VAEGCRPDHGLAQVVRAQARSLAGVSSGYLAELAHNPALAVLQSLATQQDLTLVYGARDEVHNHARIIAERVRGDIGPGAS
jgi:uncharacterized protein YeaO (DUF488 family)